VAAAPKASLRTQRIAMAGTAAPALRAAMQTTAARPVVRAAALSTQATATAPAKLKVGINGFGRIGRLVLRSILARDDIEVREALQGPPPCRRLCACRSTAPRARSA
jgi:hypothetical protein